MRSRLRFAFVALCLVQPAAAIAANHAVAFVSHDGRLAITIDGQPLASYVWDDPRILRPYFANLHAPSGAQVTRRYPPVATQDATDHDTMHPGLWLGFGDLSGADFWRNQGVVRHVEFVKGPMGQGSEGGFVARNRYLMGDKPLCDEIRTINIIADPPGFTHPATLIDWDSQFSGGDDFYFGDQEEMGLGIRVATPMTVKNGGHITNSNGLEDEKQVWGKRAAWCDYSGQVDGQGVGITLMPDPGNFRPCWFHVRDYGLMVANPFGAHAMTGGPESKIVVKRGAPLRLRFGILIHQQPSDPQKAYELWGSLVKRVP